LELRSGARLDRQLTRQTDETARQQRSMARSASRAGTPLSLVLGGLGGLLKYEARELGSERQQGE
jgi:hypothetical protein